MFDIFRHASYFENKLIKCYCVLYMTSFVYLYDATSANEGSDTTFKAFTQRLSRSILRIMINALSFLYIISSHVYNKSCVLCKNVLSSFIQKF